MDFSWIMTWMSALLMVILSTIGMYLAVIVFTRLSGLQSLSKMSSFDFAMTVAIGSIIASRILAKYPPSFQAIMALGALHCADVSGFFARKLDCCEQNSG